MACTEGLASYILLASYGSGAAELEKNVVMKGADWSPFLLDSHTNHIYYSVEDDDQAKTLPEVRAHMSALLPMCSCMLVCVHARGLEVAHGFFCVPSLLCALQVSGVVSRYCLRADAVPFAAAAVAAAGLECFVP